MSSTKDALYDLCERCNLPEEALSGSFSLVDINDFWLRYAEKWEQETAIDVWFRERFYDPGTLNGRLDTIKHYGTMGPISPEVVLSKRFGGLVSDQIVNDAIEKFVREGGNRWAKRLHGGEDPYDADFAIFVAGFDAPRKSTLDRLAQIERLGDIGQDSIQIGLIRNLAFGAAITALETYLWETMIYWVENNDEVIKGIIVSHPAFKDRAIKLSEIFTKHETLKMDILGYMQSIVWHNIDNVSMLYKYGLDITDLNLEEFKPAIMKRHDIVHRSGMSNDGQPVAVQSKDILELCTQINAFSERISKQIEARFANPGVPE